jgi:hypothetical protein
MAEALRRARQIKPGLVFIFLVQKQLLREIRPILIIIHRFQPGPVITQQTTERPAVQIGIARGKLRIHPSHRCRIRRRHRLSAARHTQQTGNGQELPPKSISAAHNAPACFCNAKMKAKPARGNIKCQMLETIPA